MISAPTAGQLVQVWYNRRAATFMPLHGRTGVVRVVGRGPGPRNHGVEIAGVLYVIPRGNLRRPLR